MYPKYDSSTEAFLYAYMEPPSCLDDSCDAIAVHIIQDNADWLKTTPMTIPQVAAYLFPEELASYSDRTNFYIFLMYCLLSDGYHAVPKIGGEGEWVWMNAMTTKQARILADSMALGGIRG